MIAEHGKAFIMLTKQKKYFKFGLILMSEWSIVLWLNPKSIMDFLPRRDHRWESSVRPSSSHTRGVRATDPASMASVTSSSDPSKTRRLAPSFATIFRSKLFFDYDLKIIRWSIFCKLTYIVMIRAWVNELRSFPLLTP